MIKLVLVQPVIYWIRLVGRNDVSWPAWLRLDAKISRCFSGSVYQGFAPIVCETPHFCTLSFPEISLSSVHTVHERAWLSTRDKRALNKNAALKQGMEYNIFMGLSHWGVCMVVGAHLWALYSGCHGSCLAVLCISKSWADFFFNKKGGNEHFI